MGQIVDDNHTLFWNETDANMTRIRIFANLESRTEVINAVLGFIGRNFQGSVFSVKTLRHALEVDGNTQVGQKGDKFSNLLYDIARKPGTSSYLTNIGKYDGQTNYALTQAGFNLFGGGFPTPYGMIHTPTPEVYQPLEHRRIQFIEAHDDEPVILETVIVTRTLNLASAVEAIKKLNEKVKSLENTVTTLYERNEELQSQLAELASLSHEYIEIDSEIQEILNTL